MRIRAGAPPILLVLSMVACSGGADPQLLGDAAAPGDDTSPISPSDDAAIGTTPPPPAAGCTVDRKGTAGVALKGKLLAPSGPMIGEVLVDASGKIACVDASCASAAGYASATVIACPTGVISPALINTHDHIDYATRGPVTHSTTRWQHRNGWRAGTGGEPKLSTPKSTTDAKIIAGAELRFLLGGTTAVVSSGGTAGLLRNLSGSASLTEGLAGSPAYYDTFPLGDSNGVELASGCGYPSIRPASTAFGKGAYVPHISEGINAAAENEFLCLTQPATNLVQERTAVIHSVGLNAKDVDTLAKAKAKVVWSARTNIDLYGNTAPVTVLKKAGVTIALGTDWLASGSMNELRELACVDSLNDRYFAKAFSDRELWEMATKNAALAAGFSSQLGELRVGLVGDVAVYDTDGATDYRAVIEAGVEDVKLVLRGGKPMVGDATLVTALSSTCEALDVCGVAKQVCVDAPSLKLADVQASIASVYPLFFCKGTTPKDEPSCVPYRDTYPSGTSATDRDGDGIADGADDCPDVFNPPRPMDATKQSDVDGDGIGDACDSKPLVAGG
jgi:cytosine/adenosine deaminase-related metal-dependent hydrolase